MKTFTLPNSLLKSLCFTLLLTGFSLAGFAQMKIGNNPTTIHPASILELESPNQALRLTQGDTAAVNSIIGSGNANASRDTTNATVKAAEGMIMFQNSGPGFGLYMRVGGWWHKIMSPSNLDSTYFKIGGNAVSDSTFLGLTTQDSLAIGTNSKGSIIIMPAGAVHILDSLVGVLAKIDTIYSKMVHADTLTVGDSLAVAHKFFVTEDSTHVINRFVLEDSLIINNLNNAVNDTALLSIGKNGTVHKMSIYSLFSANRTTINGIKSNVFHFKMGSDSTGHHGPWIDSVTYRADSIIVINIPVASDTINGLIDTTAQSFAGAKSFRDSVAIGTTATPGATLDVHGTVNLATAIVNLTTYTIGTTNDSLKTIIADVGSTGSNGASITINLPTITTQMNGRVYTIKKIGDADDNQIDAPVVIQPNGNKFADEGTSFTIYNNFTSVTIQALMVSGSGKWYIVGH